MLDMKMETFLAVCEWMNFTKAAESLHITQPAVSQQIHALEEHYGAKIFRYEAKKMLLTEAGELLFQATVTMKHDNHTLQENIHNIKTAENRFYFGATLTICEFVMARKLAHFLKSFPNRQVRMVEGNTKELLERLKKGEIDFAVVEGNFSKKEFDYQVFSSERYLPVCSKDYPFEVQPCKLEDLLNQRIITREKGSGTRDILEKNLEARNLSIEDFKFVTEIGGMNAIKSLVAEGCGITFLYEAAVIEELKEGSLAEIKLDDFQVTHDFNIIWNKGSMFAEEYRKIALVLR